MAFLETVLQGLPFPEIFIASGAVDTETGEGVELIVDGQQRVTTLHQYFTGSPDLKLSGISRYGDLSEDEKTAFLEYEVVVRDLGALDEQQTRNLFYRINSTSYSLNAMEINNARFDGALKKYCDQLSENNFFAEHGTFSTYDIKRMNDVRWTLTLVVTLLSTYFNRDTEHEHFLESYNDDFPQADEMTARLSGTFTYVDSINFDSSSRVWQKTDLFTLLAEVDRLLRDDDVPSTEDVRVRLEDFYEVVDKVASGDPRVRDPRAEEYFAATRSGTNDRSSRIRRGQVLSAVLRDEPVGSGDFEEALADR